MKHGHMQIKHSSMSTTPKVVILSVFLVASAVVGHDIFSDDFEDGSAYAWSYSVTGTPWWQRQEPAESCPDYAARYFEQDLWGCCCCSEDGYSVREYWTRRPGTASGHACDLLTGDEYLRPIFFSDFEFHWLGWSEVVNPGGEQ